jgi:hypothetical protein
MMADGGEGCDAADVDLAEYVRVGLVVCWSAEHEVAVPEQRKAVGGEAYGLAQQCDPARLELLAQGLEGWLVGSVVGPRSWIWDVGVESVDGLVPEPDDTVADQVGPHHAFDDAWLPWLVDEMPACVGFKVGGEQAAEFGRVESLLSTAALGVSHEEGRE